MHPKSRRIEFELAARPAQSAGYVYNPAMPALYSECAEEDLATVRKAGCPTFVTEDGFYWQWIAPPTRRLTAKLRNVELRSSPVSRGLSALAWRDNCPADKPYTAWRPIGPTYRFQTPLSRMRMVVDNLRLWGCTVRYRDYRNGYYAVECRLTDVCPDDPPTIFSKFPDPDTALDPSATSLDEVAWEPPLPQPASPRAYQHGRIWFTDRNLYEYLPGPAHVITLAAKPFGTWWQPAAGSNDVLREIYAAQPRLQSATALIMSTGLTGMPTSDLFTHCMRAKVAAWLPVHLRNLGCNVKTHQRCIRWFTTGYTRMSPPMIIRLCGLRRRLRDLPSFNDNWQTPTLPNTAIPVGLIREIDSVGVKSLGGIKTFIEMIRDTGCVWASGRPHFWCATTRTREGADLSALLRASKINAKTDPDDISWSN